MKKSNDEMLEDDIWTKMKILLCHIRDAEESQRIVDSIQFTHETKSTTSRYLEK
jgi:hypothetical protein